MRSINASELKKKGISVAQGEEEIAIIVRGKPSYVIVRFDRYESMSEAELTLAVAEAEADYKKGDYISESVDDHIKRVTGKSSA